MKNEDEKRDNAGSCALGHNTRDIREYASEDVGEAEARLESGALLRPRRIVPEIGSLLLS